MKRLFDLVFALLFAALLGPCILLISILILIIDGAPVFFVAERMQTLNRPFGLWKFRTMCSSNNDSGVTGGDKLDRITRTGRFLRKLRLDELPQVWNVLRGDISFVGPRPPLRVYVEAYPEIYAKVLKSKPGITGLATLAYHSHEARLLAGCTTPDETDAVYRRACIPRKAKLDLIYQNHQSLCFDLILMWKTFAKVFFH